MRQFKRDYKREKSGRHGRNLEALLNEVLERLAADKPLPHHNYDHPLVGNWIDHRDCHIKPDLVLIYQKTENNRLVLVRLGSHSELDL